MQVKLQTFGVQRNGTMTFKSECTRERNSPLYNLCRWNHRWKTFFMFFI